FFPSYTSLLLLRSFPTRRSSDLSVGHAPNVFFIPGTFLSDAGILDIPGLAVLCTLVRTFLTLAALLELFPLNNNRVFFVALLLLDRKSTRLNSSHVSISYTLFCF